MSTRQTIMDNVSRRQKRRVVRADTMYLRGVEPVTVTDAEGDSVGWRQMLTGATFDLPRAQFFARAVERITTPAAPPDATALLTAVWDIVSMRGVPIDQRLAILRTNIPGAANGTAGDETEQPIIAAWVAALRSGAEPQAVPRSRV